MAKTPRPYVGYKNDKRTVFKSAATPTQETHGDRYGAVVGPFRTMRAAIWMAKYRGPVARDVAYAERITRDFS